MKTTSFLAIVAGLVLGVYADDGVTLDLFSDTNCETPVPGTGQTFIDRGTCDTGPFQTGWSSARINGNPGSDQATITFFTKNDCGCPTCGSHGYKASDTGCLTDFGFTANAVSLMVLAP